MVAAWVSLSIADPALRRSKNLRRRNKGTITPTFPTMGASLGHSCAFAYTPGALSPPASPYTTPPTSVWSRPWSSFLRPPSFKGIRAARIPSKLLLIAASV